MSTADQHERRRELELARDELGQLYRLAAVGVWSWDIERDEVMVSDGMRAIFGLPPEPEVFSFSELLIHIDPDAREAIAKRMQDIRHGGPPTVERTTITTPEGQIRHIEGGTEALFDPDGVPRHLRGVVQDVTARVRMDEDRAAVHAVTRALAEARDVGEAIASVLEALAKSTGWQAASFWLVDRAKDVLRCERTWLSPQMASELVEFEEASVRLVFERGHGVPGEAWAKRRPVWRAVDPNQNERAFPRRAIAARARLNGVLAFPLVSGEDVIGVIELWRQPSGKPPDDLVELLASFGSQIGLFVERIRAEADLRASRELTTRIVEDAVDCVITIDAHGEVLEFNPAAERTFGYSRDRAIGNELAELIIPARYRDRHRRGLERLRAGGGGRLLGRRIELEGMRADGSEFPVELTISRLEADPPTYTGWIRDVTERRRDEVALHKSRRLLAETQRMAQIGSWEWAVDYDAVTAGEEVYRLLGLQPSESPVPLSYLLSPVAPSHRDALRRDLERCAREGRELRFVRIPLGQPVGDVSVLEWFAERVGGAGDLTVLQGTAQDVTPEYELEVELATRARQQAAVAAFGSEALASHELGPLIDSAVETVAEILEVEHTAVMELLPGGDELLLRAGKGWVDGLVGSFTVPAGGRSHAGYVIERGEPVISENVREETRFEVPEELCDHGMVSGVAVVIATETGPYGTLGAYGPETRRFSADDVSFLQGMANVLAAAFAAERAAGLERQLQQAQRLDSVGKLAGGIAHDFNNLLSVILNYADFAIEESDPLAARAEIEEIKNAAERAAELTRQLLLFSRKDVTSSEVVDPGGVVSGMETILRRTLGEHLQVEIRLAPDLWPILFADSLLEQVLLNLALNARDAMPEGGEIAIEVANVPIERRPEGVALPELPHVRLSVIDTGTGMEPEIVDRAFEPFFTTKAEGEGTGLGLATAYGIVQRAGGRVEIESVPGEGTSVHVFLPASVEAEAPGGRAVPGATPPGGSETVLLVEDEEAVRRLTKRILERAGYEVIDADGPDSAVEVWRRRAPDIDLLLTDVVMPGRSGVRLRHELAEDRPDLDVIYMSGYAGDVVTEQSGMEAPGPLLQKPFSSNDLLRAVRQTLAARGVD